MEKCTFDAFPSTMNLFEDEEASLENFKILISTPVGFNSSLNTDPFNPMN